MRWSGVEAQAAFCELLLGEQPGLDPLRELDFLLGVEQRYLADLLEVVLDRVRRRAGDGHLGRRQVVIVVAENEDLVVAAFAWRLAFRLRGGVGARGLRGGAGASLSVVRVRLIRQVGLRVDVDIDVHIGHDADQVGVRRVGDLQVRGQLDGKVLFVEGAGEVLEVCGVLKVVGVVEIDGRQLDGKVRDGTTTSSSRSWTATSPRPGAPAPAAGACSSVEGSAIPSGRSATRESRPAEPAEPDGLERLRAAELAAPTTTVTSSFAG